MLLFWLFLAVLACLLLVFVFALLELWFLSVLPSVLFVVVLMFVDVVGAVVVDSDSSAGFVVGAVGAVDVGVDVSVAAVVVVVVVF